MSRLALLLSLVGSALSLPVAGNVTHKHAALKTPKDVCDDIRSVLPGFCSLDSCDWTAPNGVDIKCTIDMIIDTFNLEAQLNICDQTVGAGMSISISDDDIGLHWSKSLRAGDSIDIPIPGLSIDIGVASAGVDLEGDLSISASAVDIEVGINACADLPFVGNVCGSSLPVIGSVLPIDVLNFEFDYQTVCTAPAPPPTPPAPPRPTPPAPKPPAPPAPAGEYHYSDPASSPWGACLADEENVSVQGITGGFCSPSCSSTQCPTDLPDGTDAVPACVLDSSRYERIGATSPRKEAHSSAAPEVKDRAEPRETRRRMQSTATSCALICMATDGSYLTCPDGATCKDVANTALCTYDDDTA